jgi:hypothetical protein
MPKHDQSLPASLALLAVEGDAQPGRCALHLYELTLLSAYAKSDSQSRHDSLSLPRVDLLAKEIEGQRRILSEANALKRSDFA